MVWVRTMLLVGLVAVPTRLCTAEVADHSSADLAAETANPRALRVTTLQFVAADLETISPGLKGP